jgi:DNA-directed RNA polymerase II subunit RPB1
MQDLVEVGPHAPAGQTGAKFIIRKDGRRINLAYLRDGASKTLEVPKRCLNMRLVLCLTTFSLHSIAAVVVFWYEPGACCLVH